MDLAGAVDELYGVTSAEFVATRTVLVRRAREAKDSELAKRLGGLRKPSVSAALVNALVRARPGLFDDLGELGERMRDAQSRLDAAALSELRGRRDDVFDRFLGAVADTARDAGRAASAGVLDEIRGGLVASLADPDAQAAFASGHLTRALSYAGFGEVDLDEAVAIDVDEARGGRGERPGHAEHGNGNAGGGEDGRAAGAGAAPDAPAVDGRARRETGGAATDDRDAAAHDDERREQERQVEAAQAALTDADRALGEAELAAAQADRDATKARERADELATLLEKARAEAEEATQRAADAHAEAAVARENVEAARGRLADLG